MGEDRVMALVINGKVAKSKEEIEKIVDEMLDFHFVIATPVKQKKGGNPWLQQIRSFSQVDHK